MNKLIINKDPDGSYRIQDRDTDIIDSGLSFEK